MGKQSYNKKHINDDKEQTHDVASRFRNRASLLVLATWTLGDHVAPEQGDHEDGDHEDYDN